MKQFNYKCVVNKNGNKVYYKRVQNKWKRISNKTGQKAEKGKRKYNPGMPSGSQIKSGQYRNEKDYISLEPINRSQKGRFAMNIIKDDILYEDNLVRILKPGVKKGIIIWTRFNQPENIDSLCKLGLKTGKKLHEENVDFGRIVYHPYIFFRAPYYSKDIDYSSPEKEIISSYGENQIDDTKAFIRVDPDNTYVFSSEIRADYAPSAKWGSPKYEKDMDTELYKSKKTLTEYLGIINENSKIEKEKENPLYNLYSSEIQAFPTFYHNYPLNDKPINRNSEILVSIPHLTPEYFVLCNDNARW